MPTFHVLTEAGLVFDSSLPQGVFSTFSDAVLVLDASGRLLWASRGAAGLLGRDPEELPGIPGSEHPRQRAMEDALRQCEAQLRHAQKVDALGRLAGGIAHDFNNLMTVVNGYSDLLLSYFPTDAGQYDPGQESPRALVLEIRKAGQKAALLTHQLLAFSCKQAAAAPKPLALSQVVLDMERMLRRSLGGSCELVTELDDSLAPALGDTGQVARAKPFSPAELGAKVREVLARVDAIARRPGPSELS